MVSGMADRASNQYLTLKVRVRMDFQSYSLLLTKNRLNGSNGVYEVCTSYLTLKPQPFNQKIAGNFYSGTPQTLCGG